MPNPTQLTVHELAAQLYDQVVPDWPGEFDFYRTLAAEAQSKNQAVLEIACGTGRITIRLAQSGARVVGMDLNPAMLDVARRNSKGIRNLRWEQADMRAFDLDERFGLAIIPGHSFQHMNTPEDQLACLASIRRHLLPGGRLVVHVDHQSFEWLGGLVSGKGGVFEDGSEARHPLSGNTVRSSRAWTYAPGTQTATVVNRWVELDAGGAVLETWEREPMHLHCIFRFEMHHLLERAGFKIEALYGDFLRSELRDDSDSMIWVAVNSGP